MKKWLFNPFVYIAGVRSLLIGTVFLIATAGICYFSNTHFDGSLHVHFGGSSPFYVYLLDQLVDWGCTVIIFYFLGLILSKSSIRFIDMAGTQALARWPMIFTAFLGFGYIAHPFTSVKDIDPAIIIRGLISLPFVVWSIALMYNAFAVSCNLKGAKAIIGFIVGVLVASVVSQMILYKFIGG